MLRGIASLASIGVLAVACSARAQSLADEQSHHEALERFRAGQEFMAAEQFDKAVDEFGKAIERDPLLSIAHYQRGQAYMNLRRYASAIKSYTGCIEASRRLYELQQAGQFRVEKERDDETREMRESVRVLEQLAAKYPGQGYALKVTQAEQHVRDLENQGSSMGGAFRPSAEVLLALGSAHFRNGDREAAEAQWLAAIQANPKLGEAHNNIAVIYMQTGRFDEAMLEVTRAEKAGFRVNPQFKADLKDRAKRSR